MRDGYVVHDEQWGMAASPHWEILGRLPPSIVVFRARFPALPAIEPRLSLDVELAPGLKLIGAGIAMGAERWRVNLDWQTTAQAPASTVSLALRRGDAPVTLPLGTGALPASQWLPDSYYRGRYELPAPSGTGPVELLVRVDSRPLTPVGPLTPAPAVRLEAEDLPGIGPDWDWSMPLRGGWLKLRQAGYSGTRAAMTNTAGVRTQTQLPAPLSPGSHRVWLKVYSYDRGENRVSLTLNGHTKQIGWRSADRGQSWIAAELPGNPGGRDLALAVDTVGQQYVTIDVIAIEPMAAR